MCSGKECNYHKKPVYTDIPCLASQAAKRGAGVMLDDGPSVAQLIDKGTIKMIDEDGTDLDDLLGDAEFDEQELAVRQGLQVGQPSSASQKRGVTIAAVVSGIFAIVTILVVSAKRMHNRRCRRRQACAICLCVL